MKCDQNSQWCESFQKNSDKKTQIKQTSKQVKVWEKCINSSMEISFRFEIFHFDIRRHRLKCWEAQVSS